ncbi:hypothetical protein [Magnetovibrio sp.]|uniref:hypothetical protein n=1 Tax=Magnetovibrio sp. TaxID=2024836 RepID=UPI002F92AF10
MQKLIACAAILTLAACAAPNTPGAPAVTPETVNSEPAAPLAAPTEKVVTITSAKPKITSAQLLGRDGDWLKSRLGEPAFVRSEKTANIWQYKNHVCVLNVFLYVEGDDAVPHVLHFDARNIKGDNTDRDRCLAMLQN